MDKQSDIKKSIEECISKTNFDNKEHYLNHMRKCLFTYLDNISKNRDPDPNRAIIEENTAYWIVNDDKFRNFLYSIRDGIFTNLIGDSEGGKTGFIDSKINNLFNENHILKNTYYYYFLQKLSELRYLTIDKKYTITLFRFITLNMKLNVGDKFIMPFPSSFTTDPHVIVKDWSDISRSDCNNANQKCKFKSVFVIDIDNNSPHIFSSYIESDDLDKTTKEVFETVNNKQKEVILPGCIVEVVQIQEINYPKTMYMDNLDKYVNGNNAYNHYIYHCKISQFIKSDAIWESMDESKNTVDDLYIPPYGNVNKIETIELEINKKRPREGEKKGTDLMELDAGTDENEEKEEKESERPIKRPRLEIQRGSGYYQKYVKYKAKYMALTKN